MIRDSGLLFWATLYMQFRYDIEMKTHHAAMLYKYLMQKIVT